MDRQISQKIKGVAICMMVLHHFCATTLFPDLSERLVEIGEVFKICVAVYAVLTGYGYFFSKEKSIRYSMKKIWNLLETYWISLFTLFIPIAIRGGWQLSGTSLLINLFGLLPNLNWFAWYVFFYVFCMFMLPYAHKIFRFKPIVNLALALGVPYIIEVVLRLLPSYSESMLIHDFFSCVLYFPCVLMGYLLAKYDLLTRLKGLFQPSMLLAVVGVAVTLIARFFVDSSFGFLLDVFYAPLLILFLVIFFEIVQGKNIKGLEYIFGILGKYSTGIWFFHAVFFSTYLCDIFQPILFLVKNPILMYIWCIILSLIGAIIYNYILCGIHRVFNLLFWRRRPVS